MKCPDCNSGLRDGARSCRCGWSKGALSSEAGPRMVCDTKGCDQAAMIRDEDGEALCHRCDEGKHNRRAFEHCKALGLNSVEDMKAYCRRTAKTLFRGQASTDTWLEQMTQPTVDRIVTMGTKTDEKLLERLRAKCVIDNENRVIDPVKRPSLRAARAAHIENERRRAEAELKRQSEELAQREREASA